MEDPTSDLKEIKRFCVGKDWKYYDDLKQKELIFAFEVSNEQRDAWVTIGFQKLRHLLSFF